MNRQFLRIYLGIALVLLLGIVGFLVLSQRWLETVRRTDFEVRAQVFADMVRAELASADLQEQYLVLNMFSLTHNLPIRLMPAFAAPLSSDEKRRLRVGEVLTLPDADMFQTFAQTVDGQVVVVGPYVASEMLRWQQGTEQEEGDTELRFFFRVFDETDVFYLIAMAGSFLCLGLVIYFLIRPLEQRIYALSDVANSFGQGHFQVRANAGERDAVAQLARSFNEMADRIEGLVEGQRETLRAVSHELRTPLARCLFLIDGLQKAQTQETRDGCILRIERALTEVNDLIEELLQFVRLDSPLKDAQFEAVDVGEELAFAREVAVDLRADIAVEISQEPLVMLANRRYLRRALTNLITNAVRHAKGWVALGCYRTGEGFALCVEDDGPGIPEAMRGRIFEPFYCTEGSGNGKLGGIGLGLAIVQRIVGLHQGRIAVADRPGGGTRFVMYFQKDRDVYRPSPPTDPHPALRVTFSRTREKEKHPQAGEGEIDD